MSLFDSGIRPAVDAWLLEKSKEVRSYGDYWSASSGGYCMRKVIFERLGVPHVETEADARKQRVFTSGHLFHSWIQEITKESGLSIAQELELQDEDLMIRGHIDDLVLIKAHVTQDEFHHLDLVNTYGSSNPKDHDKAEEIENRTDHLILYDYKTQNSRAFSYKRPDMSYYHKMQLGTYMYMLRRGCQSIPPNEHTTGFNDGHLKGDPNYFAYPNLTEARILKISKDDLRMSEEQLLWSDELEFAVIAYWTQLNSYWNDRKLPTCTCADVEGGFMALEKWNPFFYNGQPCSLDWYSLKKKEGVLNDAVQTHTSK